jgi:cytochrome o ubiquinol oxidase operon protein cyoD
MHNNATLKSYVIGFILSIVLTLAAYFLVANHLLIGGGLYAAIFGLALIQLIVQLVFFLHMAQESKPRWNLMIFLSFISIIAIVVIASLWIISHLNYNMSPTQIDNYTFEQEGMHK